MRIPSTTCAVVGENRHKKRLRMALTNRCGISSEDAGIRNHKISRSHVSIKKNSNVKTYYVKSLDLLSNFLHKDKKNLVIFMGAGDISNKAISFVSKLRDGI